MKAFWDFIDERVIIRRLVLLFTLFMTYYGTEAAIAFSASSKFDGAGTAMVIAAILAPIGALQKFTFDMYSAARNH